MTHERFKIAMESKLLKLWLIYTRKKFVLSIRGKAHFYRGKSHCPRGNLYIGTKNIEISGGYKIKKGRVQSKTLP